MYETSTVDKKNIIEQLPDVSHSHCGKQNCLNKNEKIFLN